MGRCWGSGLGCVSLLLFFSWDGCSGVDVLIWFLRIGVLDREGNARKVVNCSCVVVRDWGEESQERSILLNYFQTEQ